ncbi:tRNA cytosine-5-methylase [Trachipleistophora hominis]|uniref:tRNA cytosine-5-methylase n=1 Tax=Trachipleistophora hominis TaxID=72359 RepID=L7JUT6_TRAHO|nr:tRNA cytosine-5-methylase [Trachipleistophora hominis]
MQNKHLIPYYTTILDLSPRDMQQFIDMMDRPLPYVIRVCKSTPYYENVVKIVERMGFKRMCDNVYVLENEGESVVENEGEGMVGKGRDSVVENERGSVVENERESVVGKGGGGKGSMTGEEREGVTENEKNEENEMEDALDKKKEENGKEGVLDKERESVLDNDKEEKHEITNTENETTNKETINIKNTKENETTNKENTKDKNEQPSQPNNHCITPPLIKKYLTILTDLNLITRQELVSILPSSFLITLKTRKGALQVLDLCAAPGSKSTHMLENNITLTANDVSLKRCFVVQHRSAHMPKLLTNANGLSFPRPAVPYDAVLVDAPCSGDGTFRKNRVVVGDKNVRLMRALVIKALSMVGDGYVVYSTCAVDPVENEWVVQSVRDECEVVSVDEVGNDMFEMVRMDCNDRNGCDRNGYDRNGCNDGRDNCDRNGSCDNIPNPNIPNTKTKINYFNSNDRHVNGKYKIFYREGLTEWTTPTEYKSENYHELKKCMRFYPQDNNSGAFFIAILRRRKKNGVKGEDVKVEDAKIENTRVKDVKIEHNKVSSHNLTPHHTSNENTTVLTMNGTKYSYASPTLIHTLLSHYKLILKGHFITTPNTNRIYYINNNDQLNVANKTNVVSIGILLFTKIRDDQYRMNNLWYFGRYVRECVVVDEMMLRRMIDGERVDELRGKGLCVVRCRTWYYCVCGGRDRVDVYVKDKEKEIIRVMMGDAMV